MYVVHVDDLDVGVINDVVGIDDPSHPPLVFGARWYHDICAY